MKSLKKYNSFSSLGLLVFLLVFAVIGGYLLFRGFAATPRSYGDLNNDGVVNAIDLSTILSNWSSSNAAADANSDGTVNALDLSVVLSHYGTNTPASNAKAETLTDTFDSSSLSSNWTPYNGTGASVAEANGQLNVNLPTSAAYAGIIASKSYDLTGSYIYVQLTNPASPPAGERYLAAGDSSSYSNNSLLITLDGQNNLNANKRVANVTTNLGKVAFNAGTMSWWRIRESGGSSFFEYASSAAGPWTTLGSTANPFPVTSLYPEVGAGNYNTSPSTYTVSFDNFNSTTTTTTNNCPSGQCLPVGDIQGWHQIFSDDFNTNVPSGAGVASGGQAGYFPQAVSSKWTAYPWPWNGTPSWANYFPERTTSFHDSLMDIWMHTETINGTTYHLIDDPEPCLNTTNCSSNPGYLSGGRYVMRFKTDNFGYYHASWLLWPQTDDNGSVHWPASGEIDYPEADFNGNIYGFMHNQDGTSGGDQQGFTTAIPVSSGWHTAMIEWVSGTYCRFTLDSTVVGYTTTRVPTSPMRFNLQNGGSFANNGAVAPDSVNGHVYFDWVTVYTPN